MKKTRRLGLVYQPTYADRATGEQKTAATWWILYSVRGKRYRESSRSTNRVEAVKLLKHRLGEAGQGRSMGHDIERTTFEDLSRIIVDDYLANARPSIRRVKGALRNLGEFFGDWRAIDITEDRLSSYIENNARKGSFEPEQFRGVLTYLPEYLKPVFKVAYVTGWRVPSEIQTRKWQHVDLANGWLRLDPRRKQKQRRADVSVNPGTAEDSVHAVRADTTA